MLNPSPSHTKDLKNGTTALSLGAQHNRKVELGIKTGQLSVGIR